MYFGATNIRQWRENEASSRTRCCCGATVLILSEATYLLDTGSFDREPHAAKPRTEHEWNNTSFPSVSSPPKRVYLLLSQGRKPLYNDWKTTLGGNLDARQFATSLLRLAGTKYSHFWGHT